MMRVIDEKQSPDLVEGSAILMAEAMGVDNMSTAKAELQQCLVSYGLLYSYSNSHTELFSAIVLLLVP